MEQMKLSRKKLGSIPSVIKISVILTVIIFIISTYITRGHILDDSFIHLKYARNLLESGNLCYNIGNKSFGSSSLLYVFIISFLGQFVDFSNWPLLAKLISILSSLFIVFAIFKIIDWKVLKKSGNKWYIVYLFSIIVFLFTVPSVLRWLQDGMETSLTIFSILLSIIAVKKIIIAPKCYIYEIIAYSFILSLPALLRIDQLPIVASNILLISLLGKKRIAVKISIIIIFLILVWLIFTFFLCWFVAPRFCYR